MQQVILPIGIIILFIAVMLLLGKGLESTTKSETIYKINRFKLIENLVLFSIFLILLGLYFLYFDASQWTHPDMCKVIYE